MSNLNVYLNELHEMHTLLEELDVGLKPDKSMFKRIAKIVDSGDPKKSIAKIKKLIPPGFNAKKAYSKMESFLGDKTKEYSSFKNIATQVVKNSLPGVSKKTADISGSFLAATSILVTKKTEKNKPQKQILKSNIKEFVDKCRQFADDDDDEVKEKKSASETMDLAVGWTIIVLSVTIGLLLIKGVVVTGSLLFTFFTSIWFIIIFWVLFIFIVVIQIIGAAQS